MADDFRQKLNEKRQAKADAHAFLPLTSEQIAIQDGYMSVLTGNRDGTTILEPDENDQKFSYELALASMDVRDGKYDTLEALKGLSALETEREEAAEKKRKLRDEVMARFLYRSANDNAIDLLVHLAKNAPRENPEEIREFCGIETGDLAIIVQAKALKRVLREAGIPAASISTQEGAWMAMKALEDKEAYEVIHRSIAGQGEAIAHTYICNHQETPSAPEYVSLKTSVFPFIDTYALSPKKEAYIGGNRTLQTIPDLPPSKYAEHEIRIMPVDDLGLFPKKE